MARSKVPVKDWIRGAYLMLGSSQGISAKTFALHLDVSYKTARSMMAKIRVALKTRPCSFDITRHSEDREESKKPIGAFEGDVEIDGAYFGGKESNKHARKRRGWGRGPYDEIPVLGIRERKTGRFKAIVLPNTNKKTIQNIVSHHVKPGSTIITDEHKSYKGLDKLGYNHKSINHSRRNM